MDWLDTVERCEYEIDRLISSPSRVVLSFQRLMRNSCVIVRQSKTVRIKRKNNIT